MSIVEGLKQVQERIDTLAKCIEMESPKFSRAYIAEMLRQLSVAEIPALISKVEHIPETQEYRLIWNPNGSVSVYLPEKAGKIVCEYITHKEPAP